MKILVFVFNFLFCAAGAAILGVSLWANLDDNFRGKLDTAFGDANVELPGGLNSLTTAIWVLAAIGGFIFLTGFLGCCGAACENRLLLGLFFAIVLVLFIAELATGIAVLVLKDKFKDELKTALATVASKAEKDEEANKSLTAMEKEFKCCVGNRTNPATSPHKQCGYAYTTKTVSSCTDAFYIFMKNNAVIAGGIGIGILVIELLAMIFTCILCGGISRKDGYYA